MFLGIISHCHVLRSIPIRARRSVFHHFKILIIMKLMPKLYFI